MKLGTLKTKGCLDGELVVVSRDGRTAIKAPDVARNMQTVMDNWDEMSAPLERLYQELNGKKLDGAFEVDQTKFHSPLPRAYQFADGSAFIHHIRLVRMARNAPMPEKLETVPLMYQGLSDGFLGPYDDIPQIAMEHGTDFEGEVGIITDFVPMGTKASDAIQYIRLLVLINDVSLRGLIPEELKTGFGFFQSKPASSFSPFAVTPDELGDAWKKGRVHLPLLVDYNGDFFGNADAGHMHFDFGQLVEHAAKTRDLSAGTIIGSGTVSNEDMSRGSSCLAEKRMLEKIHDGDFKTSFMKSGDRVKIRMKSTEGEDVFGTIEQKVVSSL